MPYVVSRVSSKTFPQKPTTVLTPHMACTMAGAGALTGSLGVGATQPFVQENTGTFFIQTNTSNNDIQVDV